MSKNIETKLEEIKLKKLKIRKDFDYRGMKDKIKRAFKHVHQIEDVWIDLHTKEDVRIMEYRKITLVKIVDLNLVDIPKGMEEDDEVVDPIYGQ